MTEQEAHDILHGLLPKGGTVTLSRSQWSRSTVGSGPVCHTTDGDWHVTVTIPGELDEVECTFAAQLEDAIARITQLIKQHVPGKPPKMAAPSLTDEEPNEWRRVS